MISVNVEECNKNYKKLWKYCAENGLGVPYLLTSHNVPKEYRYSREEMDSILKRVSDKKRRMINDYYIVQRVNELEIFNRYDDLGEAEAKVLEYYEVQLRDFIKEHKMFGNLVE